MSGARVGRCGGVVIVVGWEEVRWDVACVVVNCVEETKEE